MCVCVCVCVCLKFTAKYGLNQTGSMHKNAERYADISIIQ